MDLAAPDATCRIFFPQPLQAARELRSVLVEMAKTDARQSKSDS
ncbi:hypothetical protein [Mesorhizobium sp.]